MTQLGCLKCPELKFHQSDSCDQVDLAAVISSWLTACLGEGQHAGQSTEPMTSLNQFPVTLEFAAFG